MYEDDRNEFEESSGTYRMTRDELQDQIYYSSEKTDQQSGYNTYREPEPEKTVKTKKKKAGGFGKKIIKTICLAAVFGLVSGSVMVGVNAAGSKLISVKQTESSVNVVKTSSEYVSTADGMNIADIVEEVMPSIVAVNTKIESVSTDWFGRTYTQEGEGAGSGIIISQEGDTLYLITNNHVIEDAKTVSVQFSDGTSASATVKGSDEDNDVAVLLVSMSDLSEDTKNTIKVATIGDSESLRAGESAIAIGNALGYGQSVTTGVVSAAAREVALTDKTMNLIQTSAAINPGNSGGALLNGKGEVIGINTVKYSDTSVEGMGFAIPINSALEIAKEIIEGTFTEQTADESAYLGITGGTLSDEMAEQYNAPAGVYISSVASNSAAARAGLSAGCIITGFNGEEIKTMEELQEKIAACSPGDNVTITAYFPDRGGNYEQYELTTIMGSRSEIQE